MHQTLRLSNSDGQTNIVQTYPTAKRGEGGGGKRMSGEGCRGGVKGCIICSAQKIGDLQTPGEMKSPFLDLRDHFHREVGQARIISAIFGNLLFSSAA